LSVQTVNLVQLVNSQADKPVLLLFTNLQFVGLYELGSRVAFSIRALLLAAFGPLSVEAAGTMATGGRSAVARYYRRAYRTVALVGLAPIFALYGSSYALVILWLGPSDRVSGVIALVLGVGYAVNLSTGVGTALAMGAGRPDLDRNYSALGFALNVSLTVALGLLIGRWGVVIATALGLVLSSVWLLRSVDRWLGTRILSWRAIAGSRTAGELLLLALSLGFAITVCAADAGPPSRAAAAAYLGAGAAIFGIAWGWSASREGLLRRPRIVREILARIRSRAPAAQGELG
jgi:O-antigen/teichoic acid export membrane protein